MCKKLFFPILMIIIFISGDLYSQEWTRTLTFAENSVVLDSLIFGIASGATDGIDASLGEVELPPKPPAGVFSVRFMGALLGNGLNREIRANTVDQKEYVLPENCDRTKKPIKKVPLNCYIKSS